MIGKLIAAATGATLNKQQHGSPVAGAAVGFVTMAVARRVLPARIAGLGATIAAGYLTKKLAQRAERKLKANRPGDRAERAGVADNFGLLHNAGGDASHEQIDDPGQAGKGKRDAQRNAAKTASAKTSRTGPSSRAAAPNKPAARRAAPDRATAANGSAIATDGSSADASGEERPASLLTTTAGGALTGGASDIAVETPQALADKAKRMPELH